MAGALASQLKREKTIPVTLLLANIWGRRVIIWRKKQRFNLFS